MAGRGMMDVKVDAFFKASVGKEHKRRMQLHDAAAEQRVAGGSSHACETAGSGAGLALPPIVPAGSPPSASAATPRRRGHGHRCTDVTTKQNCAYVKWFQQQTTDESSDRCQRRLMFSEIAAQPAHPTASHVNNVLLGGGTSEYNSWSTTYKSGFAAPQPHSARF